MEQLAPCCLDGGAGIDGDNRPPGVGQLGQGSFVFRGLLDGSSEPPGREGVGVEDKSESSNAVSSQVHEIRDVSRFQPAEDRDGWAVNSTAGFDRLIKSDVRT